MEITEVRMKIMNSSQKMKAIASVTFDKEIVIHDIKIINSQKGLFMAMPSRPKRKDSVGEYMDIVHPINSETRKKLEEAVFAKYEEELKNFNENEDADVSAE